jgi:4-amino-4-deoxy-L-arabinose transferase-like glycosyltransferase
MTDDGTTVVHGKPRRRLRWWPALVIVLAAAIAIPAGSYSPAFRDTVQYQVMWSLSVLGAAVILLALWLVLVSGFSARLRTGAAVGIGLCVAVQD